MMMEMMVVMMVLVVVLVVVVVVVKAMKPQTLQQRQYTPKPLPKSHKP